MDNSPGLKFAFGMRKPMKGRESKPQHSRSYSLQDRVYDLGGVSPTIPAGMVPKFLDMKINKICNLTKSGYESYNVYGSEGAFPTYKENHGSGPFVLTLGDCMYKQREVKKLDVKMQPIKYVSLFSGIGAFERAMTNLGIPFELVNYCEWDKHAAKAYSIMHGIPESKNLGDITKVDEKTLPDFNLLSWGFPCTDISNAGHQKGFLNEDGTKTRSGLYYDGLRILTHKKPAISIIENVKALVSKKFKSEFESMLKDLDEAGYNSYWKVMNALEHNIPQSRERVFIVSIRKDLDNGKFKFPFAEMTKLCLKDMCDELVDQKYNVKSVRLDQVGKLREYLKNNIASRYPGCNIEVLFEAVEKSSFQWKVCVRNISKCIDAHYACGVDNRGQRTLVWYEDKDGLYTLENIKCNIRKLTPKETFRLQGFEDSDVDKLYAQGIKDCHIYRFAGNSICVAVLEDLFKELISAFGPKQA